TRQVGHPHSFRPENAQKQQWRCVADRHRTRWWRRSRGGADGQRSESQNEGIHRTTPANRHETRDTRHARKLLGFISCPVSRVFLKPRVPCLVSHWITAAAPSPGPWASATPERRCRS